MNYFKIIIGLIFLLVNVSNFKKVDFAALSSPEQIGTLIGILLTVSIALWLIESALNKMLGSKKAIQFKDFSSLLVRPKQYIATYAEPVNSAYRPFMIFFMGLFFALNIVSSHITAETKIVELGVFIILLAFFLGYLTYFVLGGIYHLLIRLSKGSKNLSLSRNIWLFTGLPKPLIVTLTTLTGLIFYGHSGYASLFIGSAIHKVFIVLFMLSIVYSIYLSFVAARQLQKTNLVRSLVFLVALPLAFYVIIFIRLLWLKL